MDITRIITFNFVACGVYIGISCIGMLILTHVVSASISKIRNKTLGNVSVMLFLTGFLSDFLGATSGYLLLLGMEKLESNNYRKLPYIIIILVIRLAFIHDERWNNEQKSILYYAAIGAFSSILVMHILVN